MVGSRDGADGSDGCDGKLAKWCHSEWCFGELTRSFSRISHLILCKNALSSKSSGPGEIVVCQLYSEDASTFHFLWSSQYRSLNQSPKRMKSITQPGVPPLSRPAAATPTAARSAPVQETWTYGRMVGWSQLTTCSTGRKYPLVI